MCRYVPHTVLFKFFLKEVSLFKRRWIHCYFYEKFKNDFVTNESFASFIAIRSDFL